MNDNAANFSMFLFWLNDDNIIIIANEFEIL